MNRPISKSDQSESCRCLIELMQKLNFGTIKHLEIRNGEPVLHPKPRIVREVKFGGDNDPRPEFNTNNFRLKTQVLEMFQQFDQLGNGTIEVLEVKHGLPFRMLIAQPAA